MRWVRYREGGRVFYGVPREGYAIREGVGNPFPRRIPDHARSAGAAYANPCGVIGEVGELRPDEFFWLPVSASA
jgi:hypothetical protein